MCTFFSISGNDSTVDGLVNFEKLRMIAKEIRHVVRLTSANMDPALMFRQRFVGFLMSKTFWKIIVIFFFDTGGFLTQRQVLSFTFSRLKSVTSKENNIY